MPVEPNVSGVMRPESLHFAYRQPRPTAESVKQFLQCDQKEQETPEISDFVDCFAHNDSDECNKECTWCSTPIGLGICFSDDAVLVAKMYRPFFDCDLLELLLSRIRWIHHALVLALPEMTPKTLVTVLNIQMVTRVSGVRV
jgi:hypothetical protein